MNMTIYDHMDLKKWRFYINSCEISLLLITHKLPKHFSVCPGKVFSVFKCHYVPYKRSKKKKVRSHWGFPITRLLHVFAPGREHQTVSLLRGNNWQQLSLPLSSCTQLLRKMWISALPSSEKTFYTCCSAFFFLCVVLCGSVGRIKLKSTDRRKWNKQTNEG